MRIFVIRDIPTGCYIARDGSTTSHMLAAHIFDEDEQCAVRAAAGYVGSGLPDRQEWLRFELMRLEPETYSDDENEEET